MLIADILMHLGVCLPRNKGNRRMSDIKLFKLAHGQAQELQGSASDLEKPPIVYPFQHLQALQIDFLTYNLLP